MIPEAETVIFAAKRLTAVKKALPNRIVPRGTNMPRLDFQEINGGFRVVVHGSDCLQHVIVYTTNPDETRRAIEDAWSRRY